MKVLGRATVSSKPSASSSIEFGVIDEAERFRVRLQYTQDRWKDGFERLLDAEAQTFRSLREEHVDVVGDYRRAMRNAHRQMMHDFEVQCEADKVDKGLAVEEERSRCQIYELWLIDYQKLLPVEKKLRAARVEAQRKLIHDRIAEARRAREAYEEHLVTLNALDNCRRDQTRGRQHIYQAWHDTVLVQLAAWHRSAVAMHDLVELELWLRCHIALEEEDIAASTIGFVHNAVTACLLEERCARMALEKWEAHLFAEDCVRGAFHTLQYELWWLTAKEVPRRWVAETIPAPEPSLHLSRGGGS